MTAMQKDKAHLMVSKNHLMGASGRKVQPSMPVEGVREYSLEEQMCRLRLEKLGVRRKEWEVGICGRAFQENNVSNPSWWWGGVSFPLIRAAKLQLLSLLTFSSIRVVNN